MLKIDEIVVFLWWTRIYNQCPCLGLCPFTCFDWIEKCLEVYLNHSWYCSLEEKWALLMYVFFEAYGLCYGKKKFFKVRWSLARRRGKLRIPSCKWWDSIPGSLGSEAMPSPLGYHLLLSVMVIWSHATECIIFLFPLLEVEYQLEGVVVGKAEWVWIQVRRILM